ncbi:cystin-1 [Peromyscus leucopus]|uniref:cystin-1 n=1 Tax=Peromyscus leucopus TaxID=10041 RepID=UPI0010A14AD3|nr:cystin-1 [Peromyscus leucopus]
MGSGSSRSGRIPRRRRRSPDRRQAGPGEATSEGGTADQAPTAATQEETGRDPRPATPPGGREETLRLLDQLLAESEAWGPREPTPRGSARLPPAVSPEKKIKDTPEDSCASGAPGSSHKRPEGQSAISYDYSEEELMASIEREYCR